MFVHDEPLSSLAPLPGRTELEADVACLVDFEKETRGGDRTPLLVETASSTCASSRWASWQPSGSDKIGLMPPTPDQLRNEIEVLEAELKEISSGFHEGIGFFRDRLNQLISDIVGPRDALAVRFNGLQWTSGASPVRRRLDSYGGSGVLSRGDGESFSKAKQSTQEILATLRWKLARESGTTASTDTGTSSLNANEERIIAALEERVPNGAACYRQALRDLADIERISFRGVANELRAAVWEVLQRLAPDAEVMAVEGFELEQGRTAPTQKQKARFILGSRLSDTAREPPEATLCLIEEYVARLTRGVYSRSSASIHVEAERGEVQQIKMYVDPLLAELLQIYR